MSTAKHIYILLFIKPPEYYLAAEQNAECALK